MFTRKNQKKPVEPANCILFFFCVLRTGHVCPKSIHEDSYTSLNPQSFQNTCWKKLTENIHEALSRVCQSLPHSIYYNVTIWSLNLLQLAKVQNTAMLDQFINEKYEFYCKVQTSKVLWLPMYLFFWDPTRDEQQQLIISSLESCGVAQKKVSQ